MAMSKKCFVLLLLVVVAALGGGVAIVVWVMNKNDAAPAEERLPAASTDTPSAANDGGGARSREDCVRILAGSAKIEFTGKMGLSKIASRESVVRQTGFKVVRNAFWLSGDAVEDARVLEQIELAACQKTIPVVAIKMRPSEGLKISHGFQTWEHYKPDSALESWKEYDRALERQLKVLARFPSLIVLEPDLLMYAYDASNQQFRWKNAQYEEEFLKRAQRVIKRLKRSWVYLDAGNAGYLSNLKNLDQMALTLLRLHDLRGFAINTMHFVNRTYTEFIARKLHCRTGLHYVVDTSRNGGKFSLQAIRDIEKCLFDPPNMKTGIKPGWSWGSRKTVARSRRYIYSSGIPQQQQQRPLNQRQPPPRSDQESYNHFINNQNNVQRNNNNQANRNAYNQAQNGNNNNNNVPTNGYNPNGAGGRVFSSTVSRKPAATPVKVRSAAEAAGVMRSFRARLRGCVTRPTFMTAHDASVWLKTPGESDGRLYEYGSLHSCLVGHQVPCDDSCQMLNHFAAGQGPSECQCETQRTQPQQTGESPPPGDEFNFPSFPFGDK